MTILVVDAGTSGVRAVAIRADGSVQAERHVEVLPSSPHAGLVEIDAMALADAAVEVVRGVHAEVGAVDAVGIANQRASTVLWQASTGRALGPGLGWQDLRTVGRCLELRAEGVAVAPNQSATKAEWLVQQTDVDPDDLRFGTIDTWLAWTLSAGRVHATDLSNAAVTGLYDHAGGGWDVGLLDRLGIPVSAMPDVVDSSGTIGDAVVLTGSPPLTAMIGDQQASLVGQACVAPGQAKITFGTGGMLDVCLGEDPGPAPRHGTFPIVAWRRAGRTVWGREAVMLAAGTSVEWLRDGLGLIGSAAESADVAREASDADGVVFVPSLSGIGTPDWDHGARGLLIGVSRGTSRAHVVRAVLEGVAHRGADLVEATEADTDLDITTLRVDGGMAANDVFVQALADACQRPIEVSGQREATALGAGFMAGLAIGTWPDERALTELWRPARVVEPGRALDRERFADARSRAAGWIPALSALDL